MEQALGDRRAYMIGTHKIAALSGQRIAVPDKIAMDGFFSALSFGDNIIWRVPKEQADVGLRATLMPVVSANQRKVRVKVDLTQKLNLIRSSDIQGAARPVCASGFNWLWGASSCATPRLDKHGISQSAFPMSEGKVPFCKVLMFPNGETAVCRMGKFYTQREISVCPQAFEDWWVFRELLSTAAYRVDEYHVFLFLKARVADK